MKTVYAKIFRALPNDQITAVPYPLENYYAFVKEQVHQGMRQIIITSEIMLMIAKYYFRERRGKILNITFLAEDHELSKEIEELLQKANDDRAYWEDIETRLKFLNECTSIDIKRIELKAKNNNNQSYFISFQINGILGISEAYFEEESKEFIEMIERCLNL